MLNSLLIIRIRGGKLTGLQCNRQRAYSDSHLHTIPMSIVKKRPRANGPTLVRATSILLRSFLLICASLLTVGGSSIRAADDQSVINLTPGRIEREIDTGERQRFEVSLTENQLLHLSLEKGDLALRLTISDASGQRLIDEVSRRYEVMDVLMVVKSTGTCQIEIVSMEGKGKRHYQLRLDPVRKATKADLELNSAQQLMARASWLRDEWSETSLQQAIDNYEMAGNIALKRGERIAANALNQAGRTLVLMGQYRDAINRFKMAAESARKAGDKLERARALSETGRLHSYLGSIREADEHLTNAFNLLAGTEGSNSAKQVYAEALSNRGEINYSKGNLVNSRSDFDGALKLFSEVGDRTGEARVHLFKGYIAGTIGEPEKAVTEISQALALYQTVGNKAGEALCLTALGLSRSLNRDEERAMRLHRDAAEIFRSIGDRQSQAITLNALGQAYEFLSDYPAALEKYQMALKLLGENAAGDTGASSMFKIARIQRLLGHPDQSRVSYERVLQLSRAAGKRRTEANALNDLARMYASQGSREKTVRQYSRILRFYARISDRRGQATALNNLGDFLSSIGDKRRALVLYQRALEFSELAGDKAILLSTLYNLARTKRDLEAIEDALRYIQRSIQIIEELRTNVSTPEFRTSYFAGVHKQYDVLIDILMRCEKRWPGRGFTDQALLASENARARSLIDMRAEAGADIRQGVSLALLEQERELQGLLRSQAEYQMDLSTQKENQAEYAEVTKQINDLRSRYQEVEAQLRDRNPRFQALKQLAPLSVEQIQTQLLDKDSVLLEYALGDERSYLWVVSSDSFSSYELPARATLEAAALDVYKLLIARQVVGKIDSAYQGNVEASDALYFDKALKLSQTLLGQVIGQLGAKRLLVVTEGMLQYIPLDALPAPSANTATEAVDDAKDLPPLIETHEIVMLPSLFTLAAIRQEKSKSKAGDRLVAVLADPVFSSDDDRVQSSNSTRTMASVFGDSPATRGLRDIEALDRSPVRLAHAAEEAKAIVAVAPRGSAMLAQGFDATRETAISSLIGEYRIVHFATHGFVNKDHPELSSIVLSMVDRSGKRTNGFVSVRDIYNLNLSADLVVLSACDTALGKDIKGEGLVGLTHGFLASGSKTVVASLWKVDDRATAVLMSDFYRSMLQDGLSPAAALRSAKERIRREKAWQAPYFWAGFVLQGEYNQRVPIDNSSPWRPAIAILLTLGLVSLGLTILFRLRRRLLRHVT